MLFLRLGTEERDNKGIEQIIGLREMDLESKLM